MAPTLPTVCQVEEQTYMGLYGRGYWQQPSGYERVDANPPSFNFQVVSEVSIG
jgi:hypothetical protein